MKNKKIFISFSPKGDRLMKMWLQKNEMRTFSQIMIELETASSVAQLEELMEEVLEGQFSPNEKIYGVELISEKGEILRSEYELKELMKG